MKFDDLKKELLQNEEVRKEYEALKPEYEIINQIIEERHNQGLTQLEFARKIGTDQSRISKLERGTLNPSLDFLKKVAEAMGKKLHISFETV